MKSFTTSVTGKAGFGNSVEGQINQTVRVASRDEANRLIAEYPDAAKWSEEAIRGSTD
jgi:hypothetical protein